MAQPKKRGPSRPRPKPVKEILLGYCTGGMVEAEFMESVLGVVTEARHNIQVSYVYAGPLIARSRNTLAMKLMQSEKDYLLMVDTDIVFDKDHVDQLIARNKDIVSGLYYGLDRNTMDSFVIALRRQEDGSWPPIPKEDLSKGLQKVDAVGGGFVLIKRKVFEKLGVDVQRGWPFGEQIVDDRVFGEDATFSYRAAQAGFDIWLDPECRVGHKKPFII